ncbi:MAG: BatA and WFA domain-containing protein [Pirellulales bacterium]|nr:BatA and WFA domain-containing protein [Pirellulales bacterium]
MIFVTPMLLAGTAFVAVPIVLHLIMRRKPRHFEFPALRLVERRHETNRRQVRLRHLLLLALRIGLIAILAMALARPSLQFSGSFGSQESPVAAALVFDAAPRMLYREANRTRLEAARRLGAWVLTQLPRESKVAVLDTRPGPAAFQVDRAAAAERVERLEPVGNSRSLVKTMQEAYGLLTDPAHEDERGDVARKEIYVFTDLARAAWPAAEVSALLEDAAKAPDTSVFLIDVGVEDPTDCVLGELRLSAEVLPNRSPLRLRTELARLGPAVERTVELHLVSADGEDQKRDQKTVSLAAGASAELSFQIGVLEEGTHQGYVRIVGQDNLPADDVRWFTVLAQPPWPILVVDPRSPHGYVEFLTQMLAPESLRKSGQARFTCDVIAIGQLADHDLAPYAAVCLVDPPPLSPRVWQKLAEYAAAGHGLALFLGRNARPDEFRSSPEAERLLPAMLLRQARSPSGELHLSPRDLAHPILAEFRSAADAVPWSDAPVYRYWELGPLAKGAHVIVPYSDGRPALVERSVGEGRVLVLTTPVSDQAQAKPWNLLPVADAWPFFILTNQMMLYAARGADWRLNYYAGEPATVPLGIAPSKKPYLVTAPGDVKFPLSADPARNAITVTSTEAVGNYRIQSGGQADRGFSVNLTPEQTDLTRLDRAELDELLGPLSFRLARNQSQIERDVSTDRVGRELFPFLILLVAILLGAEHFVSNRFYRE